MYIAVKQSIYSNIAVKQSIYSYIAVKQSIYSYIVGHIHIASSQDGKIVKSIAEVTWPVEER